MHGFAVGLQQAIDGLIGNGDEEQGAGGNGLTDVSIAGILFNNDDIEAGGAHGFGDALAPAVSSAENTDGSGVGRE